jgi:hypothetical protein
MSLGALLQIPTVADYYYDSDFDSVIDKIIKKYHLPTERGNEFFDLMVAILNDEITIKDAPVLLAEAFVVDNVTAKAIIVDLIGNTLLPLANYIPGIEQGIIDLGGKLNDFPSSRLSKETKDFVFLVTQKAATVDVSLDDVLAKRLLFLLQQFANNQKTEESLKTFFSRPSSIGGLGLAPEQTGMLLQATLPLADLLLEVPVQSVLSPSDKSIAEAAQLNVTPEDDLILAPSHDLTIMKSLDQKPLPQSVAPSPSLIVSKPTSVAKSLSISSPEAEAIIKAAANEAAAPKVPVTDQPQSAPVTTQSQPTAHVTPTTAKPPIANAMQTPAKASEIAPDKADLKLPAKKAEEAKKIVAPVKDSLSAAIELATNQARETLKKTKISEKVFMDSAEKAIKGIRDIYQTRDLVEREWKLTGADLAAVMQAVNVGIEAYHQALPKAEVPKSVVQPTSVSDQAHIDEKFAHITQASSEKLVPPVKAQLTVGSANLQNQDGQRKMVDVVNTPRLMGPIEQLGTMTPMEFRRLSSNPSDACQKVEDLLATLEATSYEDRIQGVMAWRDSPVNQLYLSIAQEAITQSLALPEVSSRRRTAGQDSLSPAEIKALALLNAKIRF